MTSSKDPHTKTFQHINGSSQSLLDRLAVSELCKGWPLYRDASEWQNYRSLFKDDAVVWTTWSGPKNIDDFISISKKGKDKGVFIMHRECGTLVELGPSGQRAIGKMKATITQRFREGEIEYDVDCDCRFIFFCEKSTDVDGGEWKAQFVKLFYEKDKVVVVNGRTAPEFPAEELAKYPEGYKYLGAAQARLGYKIDCQLPTTRNELWLKMYEEMEKWLDGQEVNLYWD